MRLIFVVIFVGSFHAILCENLWEEMKEMGDWLDNMFEDDGDKQSADSNSHTSHHKKKKYGMCEFIKDIFGIDDDESGSDDSSTEVNLQGQPGWMQGIQNPPRPQYWPGNMPPYPGQPQPQLSPGTGGSSNYYAPGGPPPIPYQYPPQTGFYQQIPPPYFNPPMSIPNNYPGAPPFVNPYPSAVAPVAATAAPVAATAAPVTATAAPVTATAAPVTATAAPVVATAAPVAASNATNTTSAANGTSTLILSTASDTKNDTDARRR